MSTIRTFLRLPAVREAMGWAGSTLYQRIQDGVFVPPIKVGARASAWISDEVESMQAAYAAGWNAEQIRVLVSELVVTRSLTLLGVRHG